ncbi:MAG TPA: hypothetical protein VFN68_13780 [Acidimicrobiales bacterium]|nr:hypothetical protein [Acidimicrobiales bacterium]
MLIAAVLTVVGLALLGWRALCDLGAIEDRLDCDGSLPATPAASRPLLTLVQPPPAA